MAAPLDAVRRLPRAIRGVPDAAAGPFVAAVRGASDDRLRQAMAVAPVRRAVLEAIFRQMPRYLDRERAREADLSVRWVISRGGGGADVYELSAEHGRAWVRRGASDQADRPVDVTITVEATRFLRLVSGAADPMRAYLDGELDAVGDIMAAARMVSLFRMPGTRDARKQNANTETPAPRAY